MCLKYPCHSSPQNWISLRFLLSRLCFDLGTDYIYSLMRVETGIIWNITAFLSNSWMHLLELMLGDIFTPV